MSDLLDELLPEAAPRVTERDMLDLLHDRYSQTSQGTARRYACAEHVAEHSGWTTAEGTYREVTSNPQVVSAYLGTEAELHA